MTIEQATIDLISESSWGWAGLSKAARACGDPVALVRKLCSESRQLGQFEGAAGTLVTGAIVYGLVKAGSAAIRKKKEREEIMAKAAKDLESVIEAYEKRRAREAAEPFGTQAQPA